MFEKYIEKLNREKQIYLRVKVRSGASKTEFKAMLDDDTLKIDVAAPPEKGKANEELIRFLAKVFAARKSNIIIVSGSTDKVKLIKIMK